MLRLRPLGLEKWLWTTRRVSSQRHAAYATVPWRPAAVLDEWVQKEARPISLRQLTFFGRTLTENRLLSSANYVRTELPTRLAHRLRDMQTLPFVVVTNPHMSHVYDLYYKAFETLRRAREIRSVEDNENYCKVISETLQEHLTVIPRLAMGVLECQDLMRPKEMDKFMNTLLRSRISRRVIAEQHLALTETFNAPWHFPNAKAQQDPNVEFVGEVFLKCNAREVVDVCWTRATALAREAYGPTCDIPDIKVEGHLDATFPYILSHLQYVIGELLRNSIQAVVERGSGTAGSPSPIEVLICEAPQHVIIRISDQGGGIPKEIMPDLWSFSKGSRSQTRLKNLSLVPKMAATMQELKLPDHGSDTLTGHDTSKMRPSDGSLSSLTSRPPNLRLGMGLPMSRVYAEYWAGSLELHNLEGYGIDAFLQISKLGNKNEQLSTRANSADQDFSASDEALQNVSNHHPLANGQLLLPRGWLTTEKDKTQTTAALKSYSSPDTGASDEDTENLPNHHHVANGKSTLPCGWWRAEKYTMPTKAAIKPYSSLSSRVKTVNHSIRRHTSKSYGDLSNLRPKSRRLQTLSSPRRHEPERSHDLMATELQEVRQVKASPRNTTLPSFGVQNHRQVIPTRWRLNVRNAQPPGGLVSNQVEGHESPQTSYLSHSGEWSRHLERTSITIPIQGLGKEISGPIDFCIPVTRLHPDSLKFDDGVLPGYTHGPPLIEHISITNTWHGIKWPEAVELFRIHKAFIETLECMLGSELRRIDLQMLQEQCISPLLTSPTMAVVRGISFCREQLVSEMAEALYSSEDDMVNSQAGLFRLYLAASDCLVQFDGDGSRDTSMTLRVSHGQGDNAPHPVVEATWVPDTIRFEDLKDTHREGQEFRLVPQYQSKSAFNSTRSPTNIRYSIESKPDPLPWLSWHDDIAGFKGVVPLYSQDPDSRGYCRHSPRTYRDEPYDAIKTLCFEVKAVLIDDNSLSVVYERVLCTRLIIKIVPWYCQNISHSLSDPVQASPNQSRGITTVDPYSSAKLEGHTERLGTDTDNQLPEGSIGSYASELCGCGHHALESRDQEPVHANIPAISAATKPSELAAIAEIYAHLAAKYADLARFHDLVEMQATTLGPARAFTMRQKHEPYSQVYFSDNHDFGQSVKPHTGSRRSASRSSMSSLLAKYTANLSLGPRSPVISARNATQENFVGYHSNSAFAALPPAALSLLPSQTFDEYAWTRVSVPLETPDHVDQSKLDTPTKREALPALTITPPALAIPIANAGDEPTPKLCGQGSRKRHATSNMSESSPLKRAKELQKKLHEVNDSNNADTSRTTGPEFESDEEWPLPALAPGIMCDNSFASLVVRDDMTGAFTEQECKNLAIGNKEDGHTMGQLSAVQLKEDAPHHRVDTGYYADLESVAGLPTPAASSVSGSRASSGSVEFCVDADTSARKISRHEQAILWRIFSKAEDSCARNRAEANVEEPRLSADEKKAMEEAIQRSIDEMVPNKAEAKGEESRLSADEKKAMEETMQRSLDEMVGKFDDIFLYTDESGPGLDASTESEEV